MVTWAPWVRYSPFSHRMLFISPKANITSLQVCDRGRACCEAAWTDEAAECCVLQGWFWVLCWACALPRWSCLGLSCTGAGTTSRNGIECRLAAMNWPDCQWPYSNQPTRKRIDWIAIRAILCCGMLEEPGDVRWQTNCCRICLFTAVWGRSFESAGPPYL